MVHHIPAVMTLSAEGEKRLGKLSAAVRELLARTSTAASIDRLKSEVRHMSGPFVWEAINLDGALTALLPADIKSAWIFVLKNNTPSQSHYHPNSIQHMIVLEGEGTAHIGQRTKEMVRYDERADPSAVWEVIDVSVAHEFFPRGQDMVVLSFHTCAAEELLEIDATTGRQRTYEEQAL
ncbi:MAG: hypothetical protein JOZ28_03050 [Candidatus Eremiobacteraeota bacterium]|nr:hypothetical protein [Candidatus Eremiobacteraeota bacterium]